MSESRLELYKDSRKYWVDKLSGEFENTTFRYDFAKSGTDEMVVFDLTLEKELSDNIIRMSKGQDLLLYILLTAALKVLLYKYTNQSVIITSSPIYNVLNENTNSSCHILLKDSINGKMTYKEFLTGVRNTVIEGYKNQHYPIEQIIDDLKCKNQASIYRTISLLEGIHCREQIENVVSSGENDIAFVFKTVNGAVTGNLIYNSGLFSENTIKGICSSYTAILRQALSNLNITIDKIELISEAESQQILYEFNNTYEEQYDTKTISRMFEEQVELTPDNVAVEFENFRLTYRQLNERSNQLARVLLDTGVKVGDIIAIMTEYSLEMVIGIIAVLKVGAAYLPVDPKYPLERKKYMLQDSGVVILLTQKSLITQEPDITLINKAYIIDLEDKLLTAEKEASNVCVNYSQDDLVYIIYTSGSTGLPKGVMIKHKSLANFIGWRKKEYNIHSNDKILQLISISFDGFGTNFYTSLLSGAELILPGSSHWGDFKYISGLIGSRKITTMSVVPIMYKAILDNSEEDDLKTLRLVVLAGDKSNSGLIEQSYKEAGHITLVNEYGPTENCITTTALIGMSPENVESIGKPIVNNRVFIINNDNNLMPVGVSGELCVSGKGLAMGYLNKHELTEEKFVSNPFCPGEKMYRTGDVARWLPDGNIQFIGRADYQVKIRGYRVELGEIEKAILKTKLVTEAVVSDRKDISGNNYLCSYIVGSENMNISELREALIKLLPEYMIPTRFIKLDKLPLTPNGKINKRALPDPDEFNDSSVEYVKPSSLIENEIVDIWSSILRIERDKIGVNDNFFQIGGNSLLIMQIYNLIENLYPGAVTIPDLFSYHTISKLAMFIASKCCNPAEELQLNSIQIPCEYFNNDTTNRKACSFEFEIPSDTYDTLISNEKVSVQDILISAYAYLLAKLSGSGKVTFEAIISPKNMISTISMELDKLDDFWQLFTMVNQKLTSEQKHAFSVLSLKNMKISKDELSVIPLIYSKSALTENINLSDFFDLIFEFCIYKEKVNFTCEYNSSLLKDNKVEEIVNMYLQLIDLITSKYKNGYRE